MKNFVIKIGIEVHAEIKTKTKAFCGCASEFGAIPNTLVCPTCLGLPGSIPNINRLAFEKTIAAGLLLDAEISEYTMFERKNFFYPDRPKGYQLVQYTMPICKGGKIRLDNGKEVVINRIHLEEDSAKIVYEKDQTLIDFNRSGVPLVEIVADPIIMDIDEVIEYLSKLKKTLVFGEISDCISAQGGYRFDINVSVSEDENKLGTRVELINLNTTKDIKNAIAYEIERQKYMLGSGEQIVQETRVWLQSAEKTYPIRLKENVNDYRHIADPDLKTLKIKKSDIEKIKVSLPEAYQSRKIRYYSIGLNDQQVEILTSEKFISDYFDEVLLIIDEPIEIAKWIVSEIMHVYNKSHHGSSLATIINAENLATIIDLVVKKQISDNNARKLFNEVVETGKSAETLAREMELVGLVSDTEIEDIVEDILDGNIDIVGDFHKNPQHVMNFFVGKVKTMTGGRADVQTIKKLTKSKLKKKK